MDPLTAMTIASVGMNVYAGIQNSREKARAYQLQAQQNRLKAQEIQRRNEVNKQLIQEKSKELEGTQAVMSSAAGGGAGGSATLLSIYKNYRNASFQLMQEDKEAEFAFNAAMLSASEDERLAGQARRAGKLRAAQDLLTGGYRLASNMPGGSGGFSDSGGQF